jgi:hypothetical protein
VASNGIRLPHFDVLAAPKGLSKTLGQLGLQICGDFPLDVISVCLNVLLISGDEIVLREFQAAVGALYKRARS